MDNYFSAQTLIINRLMEEVPGLRAVRGARDMAEVAAHRGNAPAAYVLYDGQEPYLAAGLEAVVNQRWLVVAAVHNLRDNGNGEGERNEAGALMIYFSRALIGWSPDAEHGPMTLAKAAGPQFSGGFGFYPLAFTSRVVLSGDPP